MRQIFIALVIASWHTLLSSAAPVPKDATKGELYFPITLGSRWVYEISGRESAEIIIAVEEKDGARLVTTGYETRGEVVANQVICVSEKGISLVDTDVADLDEPFWMLKLPQTKENKWEAVLAPTGLEKATGKMIASGPEVIKVPAGTFQAIRVDMDISFAGERRKVSTWFAPHVGKVKEVRGDRIEVLKSFTPGNK